jgi:hypothetical protein
MKSRSLCQLICEDLIEQADTSKKKVVISEESLRYLIHLYKEQNILKNPILVKYDNIPQTVDELASNYQSTDSIKHYQLIMEAGERDPLIQRDKGEVHYCGIDLVLQPNGKHVIFIADHYKGFKLSLGSSKEVEKKHGIHRLQVGGNEVIFQADENHCAIFTLDHLTETAKDIKYFIDLIEDSTYDQKIHWFDLPPKYLLNCQSVSALFNYVDTVKRKEKSTLKEEESFALSSFEFDKKLSNNLEPDEALANKVKNYAIQQAAIRHGMNGYLPLQKGQYSQQELIDICYKSYSQLHEILNKALAIQGNSRRPHPLFEVVFYNIVAWSQILNKSNAFYLAFSNEQALTLMQEAIIDPKQLFAALIFDKKSARQEVNKKIKNAETFTKNCNDSTVREGIKELLQLNPAVFSEMNIIELMMHEKAQSLFKHHKIFELIKNNQLSIKKGLEIVRNPEQLKNIDAITNSFPRVTEIPLPFNLKLAQNTTHINMPFFTNHIITELRQEERKQEGGNKSTKAETDGETSPIILDIFSDF